MKKVVEKVQRVHLAWVMFVAVLLGACASNPPLDTVSNVELKRFQGRWYEIAKLPRPTQADCHGTIAVYTQTSSTTMNLVHQCNLGSLSGPLHESAADGVVNDPSVASKLSVNFGGGFYGDYWIIDLGENYEYAVVGHPTRQFLWIISRTPSIESSVLDPIIQRAKDKGFDTSKLQYTEQSS